MVVTLDRRSLSLESVMKVAEAAEKVKISPAGVRRMQRFRSILEEKVRQGQKVYGVNTGFGSLSSEEVSASDLKKHQLNLIRSHSAGVGSPMPKEVVRAAMLLRLNSLLNGNSAARPSVAVLLAGMLNEDVTPLVPAYGSLGACLAGDSLVYTNPSGPKQISELVPGDKVYSFVGNLEKVRVIDKMGDPNNFRYDFEGSLQTNRVLRKIDSGVKQTYRLQTRTRELVSTDNHPFLKLSIERATRGARAEYKLEWTELRDLHPGDLVLALKRLGEEGDSFQVGLPGLEETTPDFMRLVGMVVGDGYVRRDLKGVMIALPPGADREKYSSLVQRLFGKRPAEYKDTIVIFSRPLNRLLVTWGLATTALRKRIPGWVFGLPINQRLAFLEGYQDADATSHDAEMVHKDGHRWHQRMVTYASPNELLIKDVHALAISCGTRCGKVRLRERVRGLWYNGKHLYDYSIPTKTYEFSVMSRGFFPYSFSGKVNIDITNPSFYFDKVVSIRPDKVQAVFDIQVEGSHNFISEGLVVHNSGDLVPSAHVALTMVGEGKAYDGDILLDSAEALRRHGLQPIELAAKEGLSLINGTCFTTAFAAICVQRGKALLASANIAVGMASEVLGACVESFDERLLSLKKNKGQGYVARQIRALLKGSKRIRTNPLPQDPYSIRCAPQVHGSLKEALDFTERITMDESNSVSDNPVFLDDGTVLHGGNFHAQPSAMASDLLSFAIAYLGVTSLARTHLLLARSPPERKYMARRPGFESGLMILEYTASSLAAENAKHAYPLSSYPANVSGGVEDHASYGVNVGMKTMEVAENVSRMLAIEMICCSNFASLDEEGLSPQCRSALRAVRRHSPPLKGDRAQGQEIEHLSQAILAGRFPPKAGRRD